MFPKNRIWGVQNGSIPNFFKKSNQIGSEIKNLVSGKPVQTADRNHSFCLLCYLLVWGLAAVCRSMSLRVSGRSFFSLRNLEGSMWGSSFGSWERRELRNQFVLTVPEISSDSCSTPGTHRTKEVHTSSYSDPQGPRTRRPTTTSYSGEENQRSEDP